MGNYVDYKIYQHETDFHKIVYEYKILEISQPVRIQYKLASKGTVSSANLLLPKRQQIKNKFNKSEPNVKHIHEINLCKTCYQ